MDFNSTVSVSWNLILLTSQFYSTHILTVLIVIVNRSG